MEGKRFAIRFTAPELTGLLPHLVIIHDRNLDDTWQHVIVKGTCYDMNVWTDEAPTQVALYATYINEDGFTSTNTEDRDAQFDCEVLEIIELPTKPELLTSIKKPQMIYRELYKEFDPDGQIAVHIEYDRALDDAISAVEKQCELLESLSVGIKSNLTPSFDDVTEDDTGVWTQICTSCIIKYSLDDSIDDPCAGECICGVQGCKNEASHYMMLEEKNNA